MRRGALLAAVLVVLAGTATASARTYAPIDRPGPGLTVPAAKLARSLSCTANLTSAGQEPVLLVAGTTLTPPVNFSWNYEPALAAAGRPYCALTLPHHEMSDIQTAGEYVVHALRTMHARTGRKVEYVGYSQGGMVGRWALRFWPDTRPLVDDYVGIDPSNHGTYDANAICLATCAPSLWQQAHDSHFVTALNSGQETFAGVDYTVIYSNTDEVVFPNLGPGALSKLAGPGAVQNVAVQSICPLDVSEHLAMGTFDNVGWSLVQEAITHAGPADPARISRATCLHPLMPGVDPATFALDFARVGATAAAEIATYPHTPREPKLRSYVFG